MFRKDFLSWVETKGPDYFDQENISPRPYIFRTKLLLNANNQLYLVPPGSTLNANPSLDFGPYPPDGMLQTDGTLNPIIKNLSIYDKKILDNVVQLNNVNSYVTKPNEFCLNNSNLDCNYVEISTKPMNFKNTLLFYSCLPNTLNDPTTINNFWKQIGQKDNSGSTLTTDSHFAMSCTSENPNVDNPSNHEDGLSNGFFKPGPWNCEDLLLRS